MSSTLYFSYDDRIVKDVVQLNSYLYEQLGTAFQYVNYVPKQKRIIVAAVADPATYPSAESLQTAITDALDAYTDPSSPVFVPGTIQTTSLLKSNTLAPYSGSVITLDGTITVQNNRITNVGFPVAVTDGVNRAYVDSISAGVGLSKVTLGPTFNVNIDNTLYINGNNA